MIMKIHSCSFNDALNMVADCLGISKNSTLNQSAIENKKRTLQEAESRRKALVENRENDSAIKAGVEFEKHLWASSAFPYLVGKNTDAHGIKQYLREIIIPARDINGRVTSLQFIDEHGNKRFMSGGKVKGSFHLIGSVKKMIYIAEGYCTGASIHEETRSPVAIAFFAGNLKPVACALRDKYPDARIIIAADDDRFTSGNPGLTKATEAAKAAKAELLVPPFKDDELGTDWNDWISNQRSCHEHKKRP